MKKIPPSLAGFTLVFATLLALWWAASARWPQILPTPFDSALFTLSKAWLLLGDARITLTNTLAGFTVALAAAVATAWVGIVWPVARPVVEALNTSVQSVSALVWALFFLLAFGYSSTLPAVGVAAATAYPILLSGVIKGFERAVGEYGEAALIIGARGVGFLRHILLPASIPYLVASARPALGSALKISVVAEAFGAAGGMGYRLWVFYELHEYRGFMGWAIALLVLMIVLDKTLLEPLERWARRWM